MSDTNHKHACPDWDYLEIDSTFPEYSCCTCPKPTPTAIPAQEAEKVLVNPLDVPCGACDAPAGVRCNGGGWIGTMEYTFHNLREEKAKQINESLAPEPTQPSVALPRFDIIDGQVVIKPDGMCVHSAEVDVLETKLKAALARAEKAEKEQRRLFIRGNEAYQHSIRLEAELTTLRQQLKDSEQSENYGFGVGCKFIPREPMPSSCEECEGPMEWKLQCAHCGASESPVDNANTDFEAWWTPLVEESEQGPSQEEEGIARAAWKAGEQSGFNRGVEAAAVIVEKCWPGNESMYARIREEKEPKQ